MALAEQIKEMINTGMQEQEIVQRLTEQGISPLEINQSLEQARIKSAVSRDESAMAQQSGEMQTESIPPGEMQPSVMESQAPQEPSQQPYSVQQEYQEYQPYVQETPQYSDYQPYAQTDTNTITEIAESIAEEKITNFKKSLGNIEELKKLTGRRVEEIDERLKRIEKIIDLMQKSIISNIGNYGQAIENIQQEMSMMQNTFSKALNPLIDHAREAEDETETRQTPQHHAQTRHQTPQQHAGKKKHPIDSYLRR